MIKRHQKANPQANRGGGIVDKESFIDISNVQLIDPQSGKPTRVKYSVEGDGTKTRMAAKSGTRLKSSDSVNRNRNAKCRLPIADFKTIGN